MYEKVLLELQAELQAQEAAAKTGDSIVVGVLNFMSFSYLMLIIDQLISTTLKSNKAFNDDQ